MNIKKLIISIIAAFCILIINTSAEQVTLDVEPRGPAYNDMEISVECPVNSSNYGYVTRGSFTTNVAVSYKEYYFNDGDNTSSIFMGVRYHLVDGTTYTPLISGYWGSYVSFEQSSACSYIR